MPFKRHAKNEDHLPASQREDAVETDTEGHAARGRANKVDEYLPPAQREATDDGSDDVEGHGRFKI